MNKDQTVNMSIDSKWWVSVDINMSDKPYLIESSIYKMKSTVISSAVERWTMCSTFSWQWCHQCFWEKKCRLSLLEQVFISMTCRLSIFLQVKKYSLWQCPCGEIVFCSRKLASSKVLSCSLSINCSFWGNKRQALLLQFRKNSVILFLFSFYWPRIVHWFTS